MTIYIIGSLRNPKVPALAQRLRSLGIDVFDDWYSAGEAADASLYAYETARGRNYAEALEGYAAKHIYQLDKFHLDRCDMAVLVMDAGRSAHLELGYIRGQKKPGFILLDQIPDRIDIMYQLASKIFLNEEELIAELKKECFPCKT